MASHALDALLAALSEVDLLQQANPTPLGAAPNRPALTRAVGRASVVLLSSHFERYIRNVNEEAVGCVNSCGVVGNQLPEPLRLLHSRTVIEELASTSWDVPARATKLTQFAQTDMWLWGPNGTGTLEHGRLLGWMRTPKPEEVRRYYRYWGIDDIFTMITYKPTTRSHMWLKLTEMVEKRNNIAHGDLATEATQADVRSYAKVVKQFCVRSDRHLSRRLSKLLSTPAPW